MLEVMIECWSGAAGVASYRWSLWQDGHRIAMGENAFASADDCQAEATAYCQEEHGTAPDRVTRL